jgi:hypothetical protein
MITETNTLYAFLGNDHTHIYKVEDRFPTCIDTWEVNQIVESNTTGLCYYFPELLGYGSHDQSSDVNRSNSRIFLKEFGQSPFVKVITYPDGAKEIGIDLLCTNECIIYTLAELASNCVLDDLDQSAMEQEMKDDAWERYIKDDLTHKLKKKFNADDINPNEDQLKQLFVDLQKASNHPLEITTGGNVYIDLDRLLQHLHEAPPFLNLEYYDAA